MITAGIDAGTEYIKIVILEGDKGPKGEVTLCGTEPTAQVVDSAFRRVISHAGVGPSDICNVISTGTGAKFVSMSKREMPEFCCLARGIKYYYGSVRTLVDLGARKSLAIKCNDGNAERVNYSSKCAAGSGTFLEMAARVLHLSLEEINNLEFKTDNNLEIISTCAVFAESEIISLLHTGAKPESILNGVFKGLAERIHTQMLEIGLERDIAAAGGVAWNKPVIGALENIIHMKILVPENPQLVGALGAALIAQEEQKTA